MKADAPAIGRVVLDTNVWISAWLSTEGAPAVLVRGVIASAQPVFTRATFEELATRVWRPKFDRYLSTDYRRMLLHDVDAIAFWVDVTADLERRKFCRDGDDDKFVHAAIASDARWLVTGDDDLLSLKTTGATRILSPRAALQELAKAGS